MNQKVEKPTLSGHRLKNRKRDEKEKYDPSLFRDALIKGLNEIDTKNGTELEQISKFLDTTGNRLDYRRYSEVLFDILFAGGQLAPGGSLVIEPDRDCQTLVCVFKCEDLPALRRHYDVFNKLIRRYQYLEKAFEASLTKIVTFLRGFKEDERETLAIFTSMLLANAFCTAKVLNPLFEGHLVKEGVSIAFATTLFKAWLKEKDVNSVYSVLKRAGLESKLLELLPVNKRSLASVQSYFQEQGLAPIAEMLRVQSTLEQKKELQRSLKEMINEERPVKELVAFVKEQTQIYGLPEQEVIVIVWNTLMSSVEWNKKEELVADQAVKHIRTYITLLAGNCKSRKAETALIVKVQEYCYDNMNFMKVFQKIVVLFYKADVLSEDAILGWYKTNHSTKGKSVFLEQMKTFIEWLENAEVEESDEEDAADN